MRRTAPARAPLLLVVDDDGRTADALASWLLGQGFNAVSAASCLEARAVMDAIAIEGLLGNLGLRDGSLFGLAQALRAQRPAIVIGYADVDVVTPPELDACFVRPLDLDVLASFLAVRFARHRSGEHAIASRHRAVPPGPAASAAVRRRR
ncbi:MAG: response regulator [Labilithrix sp.]|nr:response regulator [Labilithrix sp.]